MRFRTGIPLTLPEPDSGAYPDDELGQALFTGGGVGEHLAIVVYKVVEGLASRALCAGCGGRDERIVAFGNRIPRGAGEDDSSLAAHLEQTLLPHLDAWAETHEGCDRRPLRFRLPERFVRFTRQVEASARDHLARAGHLPPQLFLLTARPPGLIVPLGDAPGRDEGLQRHVTAMERRKAAIRSYLAREDLTLRAVSLVSSALERDADEEDGVAVAYVQAAPPFGRAGRAPLAPGEDGPRMGPLRWRTRVDAQAMLDGVAALVDPWPPPAFEATRPRV